MVKTEGQERPPHPHSSLPSCSAGTIPLSKSRRIVLVNSGPQRESGHKIARDVTGPRDCVICNGSCSRENSGIKSNVKHDRDEPGSEVGRDVSLHPTPCTLHPAPCTLHPAPCTLGPIRPRPPVQCSHLTVSQLMQRTEMVQYMSLDTRVDSCNANELLTAHECKKGAFRVLGFGLRVEGLRGCGLGYGVKG